MNEKVNKLWEELSDFSQNTFGNDKIRGPLAPINHLKKEVDEVIETPYDFLEYADCFLLLLDGYRKAGGKNIEELIDFSYKKLQICKNRKWGNPDENNVVEHVE